jgi:hypothetical protein
MQPPTLLPSSNSTILECHIVKCAAFAFLARVPSCLRGTLIETLRREQLHWERTAAETLDLIEERLELAIKIGDSETPPERLRATRALHQALRQHPAEALALARGIARAFR